VSGYEPLHDAGVSLPPAGVASSVLRSRRRREYVDERGHNVFLVAYDESELPMPGDVILIPRKEKLGHDRYYVMYRLLRYRDEQDSRPVQQVVVKPLVGE
jgi:hypothetical protein